MSKPSRFSSPDYSDKTYFVTTDTWERRPLFNSERMARLFLEKLYGYRQQGRFAVHEFVVMPDHVHLLITPRGTTLERAVQFIKGGFSHAVSAELGSKMEIWQRGFSDHRIRGSEDYRLHVQYIRQNPVRRGLAQRPEEYPYSSAYPGFTLDPAPDLSG